MQENKNKLDKKLMEAVVSKLVNDNTVNSNSNVSLTDELINEMVNYGAIRKCINTLLKGVSSRELVVKCENNIENDNKTLEIQARINNIAKKTQVIENIAMAYFKKMAVHEIVVNENFLITKLVNIPLSAVKYDKETKIFNLKTVDGEVPLTDINKWLISIYNEGVGYRQGQSILETVLNDYLDIKNIKNKIENIINKYGDTILIFAYGVDQTEEEVQETAQELKRANGKNVLAIPLSDGNLRDNLFTIRLADIDTQIHERLLEKYEKNISNLLLGSSLSMDTGKGTSSYALGEIHQEEKEKIEDSIALFVRDELDKIINVDAMLYGYDPNLYYISLDREEREEERIAIDKSKQELRQQKVQEIFTLSQAGYELDENELKEITGFKTIKKKESTTNGRI